MSKVLDSQDQQEIYMPVQTKFYMDTYQLVSRKLCGKAHRESFSFLTQSNMLAFTFFAKNAFIYLLETSTFLHLIRL